MDEIIEILNTWTGLSSHFIGECYDIATPFIDKDYKGIVPYVRFVSSQLFIDCHLSSESSLLLIRSGKEWDADIINRSVMEGTVKYVYLLFGSNERVKEKAVEYWEILPDYSSIRRHEKLQSFLGTIGNPDSDEWLPFKKLLLSNDDIEKLRNGTNRKERKNLEQQWSLFGMTTYLQKKDPDRLGLLVHLAHNYGMSSHLIHKDGDGVGMVWERYRRTKEDQISVKLGHCARVISDICTFSKLRLLQLLKFCNQETEVISELENKYSMQFEELRKAGESFIKNEYK